MLYSLFLIFMSSLASSNISEVYMVSTKKQDLKQPMTMDQNHYNQDQNKSFLPKVFILFCYISGKTI